MANVCHWHQMAPGPYLNGGKAPELCVRDYPDFVSDYFKTKGYFHSCLDLAQQWPILPDGSKAGEFTQRLSTCNGQCESKKSAKPGIYVDVGANIGACVMQMLARPDVDQVVAFEPSPANLYYMTNSLVKQIQSGDASVMKNLVLYPRPLGASRSTHTLSEQPGNAGNTG